ncbi:hypothetical protein QFZ67_000393 [Streptomyces sp. V1I1]|nr:hypothetical protein [Streptomyces sp. V1I1]
MKTHTPPRVRIRITRGTMAAAMGAALLPIAACASDPPAPPRPTGKPSIEPCLTPSNDLVVDVDGDGHADRVSDPSHVGKRLTIAFGKDSGYGTPVGARQLVGSAGKDQHDVLATVSDFDQDGWTDLVVVATGKWRGDDPIDPRVAQVRWGPFSAAGGGQRTRDLDLGETRGIAVADYNHDRYPDLAIYTYAGDGVYQTEARLGSQSDGIANATDQVRDRYTVDNYTDDSTPRNMPRSGLSEFLPDCPSRQGS